MKFKKGSRRTYWVDFSMVYPESVVISSEKHLTKNEVKAAAFKKIEMFWPVNFLNKKSLEITEIE
jgi:hypothetical protein